jgi:hypothetical protein
MHFSTLRKRCSSKKTPKCTMLLLNVKNKGGIGYQKADSRQHNPVSSFLGKSIRQYTIKYICIRLYRMWRDILIPPFPPDRNQKSGWDQSITHPLRATIPYPSLHLHCQAETFPCKYRHEHKSSYGTLFFHCMGSLGPRSLIAHKFNKKPTMRSSLLLLGSSPSPAETFDFDFPR